MDITCLAQTPSSTPPPLDGRGCEPVLRKSVIYKLCKSSPKSLILQNAFSPRLSMYLNLQIVLHRYVRHPSNPWHFATLGALHYWSIGPLDHALQADI